MKKIMNRVDDFLSESLAGFATAHSDVVTLNSEPVFVRRRQLTPGKVALISGGGSGHEPLHAGFVGYGMLDAACPGQVFTSPTPDQMIAAAQAADTGAGVLFVVKNYSGDVMNFEMAAEMCETQNEMVWARSLITRQPLRRTGGAASIIGLPGADGRRGLAIYRSRNLFIRSFARSTLSSSDRVKYIDPVRIDGSRPASRAMLATSAHCSAHASGWGVIGIQPSNRRPT